MATQLEINVDTKVLEDKIKELESLLLNIEYPDEKEVLGMGKMTEYMGNINITSSDLMVSLETLISETITFLQDAKDGFIEVDETMAKELSE